MASESVLVPSALFTVVHVVEKSSDGVEVVLIDEDASIVVDSPQDDVGDVVPSVFPLLEEVMTELLDDSAVVVEVLDELVGITAEDVGRASEDSVEAEVELSEVEAG